MSWGVLRIFHLLPASQRGSFRCVPEPVSYPTNTQNTQQFPIRPHSAWIPNQRSEWSGLPTMASYAPKLAKWVDEPNSVFQLNWTEPIFKSSWTFDPRRLNLGQRACGPGYGPLSKLIVLNLRWRNWLFVSNPFLEKSMENSSSHARTKTKNKRKDKCVCSNHWKQATEIKSWGIVWIIS